MRIVAMLNSNYTLTLFGKYIFMMLLKEFYIGMDNLREELRKDINKLG